MVTHLWVKAQPSPVDEVLPMTDFPGCIYSVNYRRLGLIAWFNNCERCLSNDIANLINASRFRGGGHTPRPIMGCGLCRKADQSVYRSSKKAVAADSFNNRTVLFDQNYFLTAEAW